MEETIKINPGDFASTIAQRGGFSVSDLVKANPTYKGFVKDPTGATIYAGDVLNAPVFPKLPESKTIAETTPSAPAETPKYDIPNLPGDNTDLTAVIKSITGLYGMSGDNKVEAEQNTLYNDIKGLIDKSKGKSEYQTQQEDNLGISTMEKDIQELTNQINQLGKEQTAQQLGYESDPEIRGMRGLGARNTQLERENAIKALTLSSQIQAKQGNLQIAKDQVQRAVDIKYKPFEDELNNKLKVYELNKDQLTRADKKRGDIMSAAWNYQLQTLQDKKEEEKTISSYALTAAKNGASNTLVKEIQDAKSSAEALNILTKGGYLKSSSEVLDEQYKKLQISKMQKEISLLGEPTAEQKKKEEAAMKSEQGQIGTLQQKVDLIDAIKNSGGMADRVGTNSFSRVPTSWWEKAGRIINPYGNIKDIYLENTGKGQQFAGGVHQLASQEFLDALINAKQQGATFGALTDREGDALRAAATKINDWEIKDKSGKGIGVWNIDENSFNAELNRIKEIANKAIVKAQGNLLSSEEKTLIDTLFKSQDASFYFK